MSELFDDSFPEIRDDNLQATLRQLLARTMTLDAAFMALHKTGGLPAGFMEAFKAEWLQSLTNVRNDRTREAFDATMAIWLDELQAH